MTTIEGEEILLDTIQKLESRSCLIPIDEIILSILKGISTDDFEEEYGKNERVKEYVYLLRARGLANVEDSIIKMTPEGVESVRNIRFRL